MLAVFVVVLTALGPDPAAMIASPPVQLPPCGDNWDLVGAFRLPDPTGREVVVRLYADDSDARAHKAWATGKSAIYTYPNFFALHAVSWAGGKAWEHREVYSAARVRFSRVRERGADGPVLELRPNFMVQIDSDKPLGPQLKRADEINKPFAVRLTLKGGVPTLKEVAAEPARAPDRGGRK
jgi:hypothetical protein